MKKNNDTRHKSSKSRVKSIASGSHYHEKHAGHITGYGEKTFEQQNEQD